MESVALVALFTSVIVTFFVIMDPLGTVPIFIALTSKEKAQKQKKLALQSVLISFSVIIVFALFGNQILGFLDISLPSLQASGGLLLLLVALELLTGKDAEPAKTGDVSVALVPLGTPLLAGPGAIAATIIFVRQSNSLIDFLTIITGLVAVHIILYLFLRFSIPVMRIVGRGGITVATKLAGLLLAAIAVQMMVGAIAEFVKIYS
jgi:multiple antibiotic resistance protein